MIFLKQITKSLNLIMSLNLTMKNLDHIIRNLQHIMKNLNHIMRILHHTTMSLNHILNTQQKKQVIANVSTLIEHYTMADFGKFHSKTLQGYEFY